MYLTVTETINNLFLNIQNQKNLCNLDVYSKFNSCNYFFQKAGRNDLLEKLTFSVPIFHCYGHFMSSKIIIFQNLW